MDRLVRSTCVLLVLGLVGAACNASDQGRGAVTSEVVQLSAPAATVAAPAGGVDPAPAAAPDSDPEPSASAAEPAASDPHGPQTTAVDARVHHPSTESWPPDPVVYAPGVTTHAAGPLEPRLGNGMVELPDGRIAIWGGNMEGPNFGRPDLGWIDYNDGALFDPTTGEWEAMTPSPLEPGGDFGVRGVLIGDEVLWLRGPSGAAWNWRSGTWRSIADAPAPVRDAVWTGDRVVATGADASYDPVEDRWTPDDEMRTGDAWRSRIFVVDGRLVLFRGSTLRVEVQRTDGTGWDDIGGGPVGGWGDAAVVGERLIVASERGGVHALDVVARQWEELPSLPLRFWKADPQLFAVDATVVAYAGPGVAHLVDGAWKPVARGPVHGTSVASGSTLWTYGLAGGEPAMQSLDPGAIDASPWVLVGSWPFDTSEVDLALVAELGQFLGPSIRAEVRSQEWSCVLVVLTASSGPMQASPAHTHQVVVGDERDEGVGITCDDPADTGDVAGRFAASRFAIEAARYTTALQDVGDWTANLGAAGVEVHPDGAPLRLVPGAGADAVTIEPDAPNADWHVGGVNVVETFRTADVLQAIGGLWLDCMPENNSQVFVDAIVILSVDDTDRSCTGPVLRLAIDHLDRIVAIDMFVPGA